MNRTSVNQRRSLIAWLCFNAIALLVNVIPFKFKVRDEQPWSVVGKGTNIQVHEEYSQYLPYDSLIARKDDIRSEIDLFTHGPNTDFDHNTPDDFAYKNNDEGTFWPFTTKFLYSFHPRYSYFRSPGKLQYVEDSRTTVTGFLGVFNGYGYREFLIYTLLGFAVVYVPKLWSKNS